MITTVARAQHYAHATLWTRVSVKKDFGKHWEAQVDYTWRRQNNYHAATWNLLENKYQIAYRLLVGYQTGPWTFQVNPSFYYSYPLLGKEEDFNNPAGGEWRFTATAEWTKAWQRVKFRVRPGYEYRLLERNDYQPTGRFRIRLQTRYDLSERVTWVLSDEPLLNVGPNAAPVFFNQNQAYTGFDIALVKSWLNLEVGYYYILRERRTRVEFDDEHALNLQLKFKL